MPLSYFYNLPVIKYAVKGDNEFRIYDVLGVFIVFYYIKYFKIINAEIKKIIFFRRFQYFIIYCSVSIIFTLLFSIFYRDRFIWFIQSFLYLYHMWVFYLGAVFFYLYIINIETYKKIITYILILIIVSSFIVILQHMGIIPFLFSKVYEIGYHGFLSGTFGPNKIVLGMTMLISFTFIIGLFYESRLKISRLLLIIALFGSSIAILLSGSRTTYVGIIVFLVYFFIRKTGKFINLGILGGVMFVFLLTVNPQIFEKINYIINNRIVNRIEGPDDIDSVEDMTGVYEDLGAGRSDLHLMYVNHLLNRPYIIPFGIGFNNRLLIGSSAHNMYLSLINEVGIFGLILFIRWMLSFLIIKKRKLPYLQLALNGLVLSMLVTLYFGEHLYVYRPLFGILGYFMIICVLLLVPLRKSIYEK